MAEVITIILKVVALLLLVFGMIFSFLGMLGVMRLPDVYTRLHATGKITAFGAVMVMGAAVILLPGLTLVKGLAIIIFLLMASPVVAHAISSAAYKTGLPMAKAQTDELSKVLPKGTGKDV